MLAGAGHAAARRHAADGDLRHRERCGMSPRKTASSRPRVLVLEICPLRRCLAVELGRGLGEAHGTKNISCSASLSVDGLTPTQPGRLP